MALELIDKLNVEIPEKLNLGKAIIPITGDVYIHKHHNKLRDKYEYDTKVGCLVDLSEASYYMLKYLAWIELPLILYDMFK